MVSSTSRPHFTPGKDSVPILQEAGWAPEPVWTGGKSRLYRDSIPDRPARSSVAILTELPGPQIDNKLVYKLRGAKCAQLVEAMCHKAGGFGFDSCWGLWKFKSDLFLLCPLSSL